MKILHIGENDSFGGASRASYRIHRGLLAAGAESRLFVRSKFSDDATVLTCSGERAQFGAYVAPKIDSFLKRRLHPKCSRDTFSINLFPGMSIPQKLVSEADIIHLHWIGQTTLSYKDIYKFNKPIVWRFPDIFPLTGGCHCSGGCDKYVSECGACPFLESSRDYDLSTYNFRKKLKAIQRVDKLVVAAPSRWMVRCASNSRIFQGRDIRHVPTGVDLEAFSPMDKKQARRLLGLDENCAKKVVAFGAVGAGSLPRKGFPFLHSAIQALSGASTEDAGNYKLLVFGSSNDSFGEELGVDIEYLGRFYDDVSLRLVYAAADVMIVPSTEENLPNNGLEAFACGTPVVGFNIGGMPDLIDDKVNGRIACEINADSLADCIRWVLADDERHKALCRSAREKAEQCFDLKRQVDDYLTIYRDLLGEA